MTETSGTNSDRALRKQGQKFSERRKKQAEAKKKKKEKKHSKKNIDPPYSEVDQLISLYQSSQFDSAEKLARHISEKYPQYLFARKILGDLLWRRHSKSEAIETYRTAAKIDPRDAVVHYNLGFMAHDLENLDEAKTRYEIALSLKPDYADAHSNLGSIFQHIGRLDEAENSYRRALALKPRDAEIYYNLGNTLQDMGRLSEAEALYNKATTLSPDSCRVYNNLGNTLAKLGKLDEAETNYKRAIALKNDYAEARSNSLFLNASMRFDPNYYLKEAREFADMVTRQIEMPFSTWSYSRCQDSLRIGFVSGDFKRHPVGIFLEGLLVQLQDSTVELYAYPTNDPCGPVTDRLKRLFHSWKPIYEQSDSEAAKLIHNDGIHILVDLAGHTVGNRLPIFGRKPAPIQISWLGYFASTGMRQIDYILGDPYVTPEENAHHFTEKIWQLPDIYLCFTPPTVALEVSSLPALSNGFVTFGCFTNLSRLTEEVVTTWAKILHAVPNSMLFLKDIRLDHESGREEFLSRFAAFDITHDRLLLEGRSSREDYFESYNCVDIALSPFPYGGGTTTAEGLWMGVPVITRSGNYFLSSLGESIAHNTGLSDWIAINNDDYVAKAVKFSSDLEALHDLRLNLRAALLKTPLYDLERFSHCFEKALWEMRGIIDQRHL